MQRSVDRYVRLFDRLLPGRLAGLYVVGSTAYGAFVPGRSDIDMIAILDRRLGVGELRRIRAVQVLSAAATAPPALVRGNLNAPGTCNVSFVAAADVSRPVSEIEPIANHVGHDFAAGRAFDVNPVVWQTLARRGIPVRGPAPSLLGLQVEAGSLAEWNRRNLREYWLPLGHRLQRGLTLRAVLTPRWNTAWGVLGAPRLAYTIATGEVTTKEGAGTWARGRYEEHWHPIIDEALAYWRGQPLTGPAFRPRRSRARATGDFVVHVAETA